MNFISGCCSFKYRYIGIVISMSLILSGVACSMKNQNVPYMTIEGIKPGNSLVQVTMLNSSPIAPMSYEVIVNGESIGSVGFKKMLSWQQEAGPVEISLKKSANIIKQVLRPNMIKFEAEDGQAYFPVRFPEGRLNL